MKTSALKICQESFFDDIDSIKIYKKKTESLESYMTDIPNSLQEKQVTTPIGRFSTPDNIGTELSENEGKVVEYESDIEELNNLRSMLLENQNEGLNEGTAEDVISRIEPITKNVDEDIRIPSLEQFTDVHTKIPAIKITLEAIDKIFNKIKLKDRNLINSLRKNKNFFTILNNNEIPKNIGLESFFGSKKLPESNISEKTQLHEFNSRPFGKLIEYHFETPDTYCSSIKIESSFEEVGYHMALTNNDKKQLKAIKDLELLKYDLGKNTIKLEDYQEKKKQIVSDLNKECNRSPFDHTEVHDWFYSLLNILYTGGSFKSSKFDKK